MPISSTPPGTDPEWATDPDTTLEPSGPKKALGWVLGERPGFNVFNWWMNLVYQWIDYAKNALSELDTTKAEKSGGVYTGDLNPDANDTRSLGTGGGTPKRWKVNASTLDVSSTITLPSGTPNLVGDLIPVTTDTDVDIGDGSHRIRKIWSTDADFSDDVTVSGDLAVGTLASDLVPDSNSRVLGDATHRYALFARDIAFGDLGTKPLNKLSSACVILASCHVQDDGTLDSNYNVASATKDATGRYTVTFTNAVGSANFPLVSCDDQTGSVDPRIMSAALGVSGGTCKVKSLNHTGADSDAAFNLVVFGVAP